MIIFPDRAIKGFDAEANEPLKFYDEQAECASMEVLQLAFGFAVHVSYVDDEASP